MRTRNPEVNIDSHGYVKSINAEGRRNAASQALSQRAAEEGWNLELSAVALKAIYLPRRTQRAAEETLNLGEHRMLKRRCFSPLRKMRTLRKAEKGQILRVKHDCYGGDV